MIVLAQFLQEFHCIKLFMQISKFQYLFLKHTEKKKHNFPFDYSQIDVLSICSSSANCGLMLH